MLARSWPSVRVLKLCVSDPVAMEAGVVPVRDVDLGDRATEQVLGVEDQQPKVGLAHPRSPRRRCRACPDHAQLCVSASIARERTAVFGRYAQHFACLPYVPHKNRITSFVHYDLDSAGRFSAIRVGSYG
jgi:hypothetical protein